MLFRWRRVDYFSGIPDRRLGLLVCLIGSLFVLPAWGGALLAHPETPVTSLSTYQLSDLFTLKQKNWSNNMRVQIILLKKDSPEYVDFITRKLGIFPYQLKRHWKRVNFSGRGRQPIFVSSVDQLLKQIAQTPGAIGYVPDDGQGSAMRHSLQQELQRVEISP